jgi:hypothetical protein
MLCTHIYDTFIWREKNYANPRLKTRHTYLFQDELHRDKLAWYVNTSFFSSELMFTGSDKQGTLVSMSVIPHQSLTAHKRPKKPAIVAEGSGDLCTPELTRGHSFIALPAILRNHVLSPKASSGTTSIM